ncbi:MAG: hypothetical protein WC656_01290 [Sulfurimonas sp.]|jgi:hypothetical protein
MDKREIIQQSQLDEIVKELASMFGLDYSEAYKIILESVSEVYGSDYPVLLEEDGIYAVYNDKKQESALKFSKIKYSAKKSLLIISKIREKANLFYLQKQKEKVIHFIKNKKSYLHAVYSYTIDESDYYELFYDMKHERMMHAVKASMPRSANKKSRVYIDFTSARYEQGAVVFREHKTFKTLENLKSFTRDISSEVYQKIQKRVWMEVRSVNLRRKEVYVHLPYMSTLGVIEHIKSRFYEVFGLRVVLIYLKAKSV